jgi:hypothetical protein
MDSHTHVSTSKLMNRFRLNSILQVYNKIHKKNSVVSARKRTIPTERPPLVSEVSANFFVDRWCHVVSVTNPHGRILGFLDRSRYYFFQVL